MLMHDISFMEDPLLTKPLAEYHRLDKVSQIELRFSSLVIVRRLKSITIRGER